DVIHVSKLQLVFEKLLAHRKNDRQLAFPASEHSAEASLSVCSTANAVDHVVIDRRSREDVRTQKVDIASAKTLDACLHGQLRFLFVDRIRKCVRFQLIVLSRRTFETGTINGNAAEVNQLLDLPSHA